MMLRTLKCDLSRSLANRGFVCAIIVTAVLCFSTEVYSDHLNGKTYSVFEAIFTLDRDFMSSQIDFNPAIIARKALSGYSAMALPVTAAFPFVFAFISERNSGNMRLVISRMGRLKYYLSKFISAIFCGGLCTMLGVIFFVILLYILFPNTQSPQIIAEYLPNGVYITIAKKALSAFVYGAASVLPAFFLCSFCSNLYIILCVPFLLKFITETLLSDIQTNAVAAGEYDVFDRTLPFTPSSASALFEIEVNVIFVKIIAVNMLFAAAIFVGFAVIMEKRADKGC